MTPPAHTRLDGSAVPPRSKAKIAENAGAVRKALGMENIRHFPITRIYELLPYMLEGASFEVLEDFELNGDHGRTYPDKGLIQLPETVYEGASRGEGRDRFTLSHELGHLLMHRGIAFSRIDPKAPPKIYCNSEWQADTFASYLLMPDNLLASCSSVVEVMNDFGVSFEAARARFKTIKNV